MSGPRTIVLVDDDAFIMNATADLLRGAGFHVHTCDQWTELMGLLRSTDPSLILLDYNMPTIKGDDICGALKRNMSDKPVKIVIFSSEEESRLRVIVGECGADGYLSKTRGRIHIVDEVSAILA